MARRIVTVTAILDLAALAVAQVVASLATFRTPLPWLHRRDVWARNYVLVAAVTWLALSLAVCWGQRRGPWTENMVLVATEKVLVDHLRAAPHVNVLEVLDPAGAIPERPLPPGTTLAVDLRAVLSDEMARFVSSCNLAGYPMRSLVTAYEEHTGRLAIVHLYEGWELTVPLSGRVPYVRFKRVLDSFLVLLVSPLVAALGFLFALAIKLDSTGPVIFKQFRI